MHVQDSASFPELQPDSPCIPGTAACTSQDADGTLTARTDERALYVSKARGRNRVTVYDEVTDEEGGPRSRTAA